MLRFPAAVVFPLVLLANVSAAGELPLIRGSWLRVTTGDLEIYSTASEATARALALRLERLRAILLPMLDGGEQQQKPICIIDFGSRGEFEPYAPMSRSIGFFLPGARRDFVVLDGSHPPGRAAGHEYVHFLMRRSGWRLPTWLNEGLAELYSNVDDAGLGALIPGRMLALHRNPWIGLGELLEAGPSSRIFTDAGSVDAAYAESWLLAHMLVLDPRYAAKFPEFLETLQSEETANAFSQVYDESLEQVEQDLKGYAEIGEANSRRLESVAASAPQIMNIEHEADYDGLTAVAEMLGNYRGRTEQSRDLYRWIEREFPARVP